jgi:hypothetical protein
MDRGNSFSNGGTNSGLNGSGPAAPPLTITGVQCGAAQDDRWGNGPSAATA